MVTSGDGADAVAALPLLQESLEVRDRVSALANLQEQVGGDSARACARIALLAVDGECPGERHLGDRGFLALLEPHGLRGRTSLERVVARFGFDRVVVAHLVDDPALLALEGLQEFEVGARCGVLEEVGKEVLHFVDVRLHVDLDDLLQQQGRVGDAHVALVLIDLERIL